LARNLGRRIGADRVTLLEEACRKIDDIEEEVAGGSK